MKEIIKVRPYSGGLYEVYKIYKDSTDYERELTLHVGTFTECESYVRLHEDGYI